MFENIKVDYYGTPTPLTGVASLSAPEPRLVTISPWDASQIPAIEKAIQNSQMGFNPSNDGKIIRVPFPQLTEERRKELVKIVKKMGEDAKVAIRNERRDYSIKRKRSYGNIILMDNKKLVIEELFKECSKRNNYIFNNNLVKEISKKIGFGNPFDVTKIDIKEKLPMSLLEKDYCIIHLGEGKHKFIKGVNTVYHEFEDIKQDDIIKWDYKKSLLNQYNDSESNILSVANNQRILHDFLFGSDNEYYSLSIEKCPKTYFPHRTKKTLEYSFNNTQIKAKNQQIEIDLTIEYNGIIGLFEAKNGKPTNFNIYQLFYPYLYYALSDLEYKQIKCVYLVRTKQNNTSEITLWEYEFEDKKLDSIKYIKSKRYILNTLQGA